MGWADQTHVEHKKGISRRTLSLMYLGAYVGAALPFFFMLMLEKKGHFGSIVFRLPQFLLIFPVGLTFFLSNALGSTLALVIAYTLYVVVIVTGIVTKSIKVYLLFVLLTIINLAGCCLG